MQRIYDPERARRLRADLIGTALIAVSVVILTAWLASAVYCQYDPGAIKGECGQSLYNLVTQ